MLNTMLKWSARIVLLVVLMAAGSFVRGQTTQFVFEGDIGDPGFGGALDMQFRLYDASFGDVQIGSLVSRPSVAVTAGKFKVTLDFGSSPLSGADRWVEIRTSPVGAGTFTIVNPRKQILSAPYAIQSLNSAVAANALRLGSVDAYNFVQNSDPRLSDQRAPLPNSSNYIQNTSIPQNAFFNISQTGTASVLNAMSHFSLNNTPILRVVGDNLYHGYGSGLTTTTGYMNTGSGHWSLRSMTTGSGNSVFGYYAGYALATGYGNAFFGSYAGSQTTSNHNSFFGSTAGSGNTSGSGGSYFGSDAGYRNTAGARNTFIGASSGNANTTGSDNTFVGHGSGYGNVSGSNNTAIGANANIPAGLTYATAIGAGASATHNYQVMLGRSSDNVRVPGRFAVYQLGTTGNLALCRNSQMELATCSSSIRYKKDIEPYKPGLDLVKRLRPVSFTWRDGGALDLGLVAEEVNKLDPLLTVYGEKGEVEGVKYDRIGVVLINAIKEQQAEIASQQKQIDEQRQMIDSLKKIVCATSNAALCK